MTRKKEKKYFSLHNIKENPSTVGEQKRCYSKEGAKTVNVIKVRPSQTIPLNKSSERLTHTVLKKQREENGFMQLPQAENFYFKTQIQGPHSWSGISKTTHSNVCFERTPKTKSLEKKEHNNICKSVYRKILKLYCYHFQEFLIAESQVKMKNL